MERWGGIFLAAQGNDKGPHQRSAGRSREDGLALGQPQKLDR